MNTQHTQQRYYHYIYSADLTSRNSVSRVEAPVLFCLRPVAAVRRVAEPRGCAAAEVLVARQQLRVHRLHPRPVTRPGLELQTKIRGDFTITEKDPTPSPSP